MARRDSQNSRASERGVQMSWCDQNQNVFAVKHRIRWESSVVVTASFFTFRIMCCFSKVWPGDTWSCLWEEHSGKSWCSLFCPGHDPNSFYSCYLICSILFLFVNTDFHQTMFNPIAFSGSADVDECQTGVHRCGEGQICHNLPGAYRCDCKLGYQYDAFSRSCIGMYGAGWGEGTDGLSLRGVFSTFAGCSY